MKLDSIVDLELMEEQTVIEAANEMMEMANLYYNDTGIPYAIWFGEVGGQHGPRIKVSNIKGKMSSDCFVMSVSKSPIIFTPRSCKISQDDVNMISDWVMLNYDVLMQMWEVSEAGEGESLLPLLQHLRKV
jgi:hypothetical protein